MGNPAVVSRSNRQCRFRRASRKHQIRLRALNRRCGKRGARKTAVAALRLRVCPAPWQHRGGTWACRSGHVSFAPVAVVFLSARSLALRFSTWTFGGGLGGRTMVKVGIPRGVQVLRALALIAQRSGGAVWYVDCGSGFCQHDLFVHSLKRYLGQVGAHFAGRALSERYGILPT